jgi:hypothetical protein
MLYREIIAVCSQIHTKPINTLCGQDAECLCVKPSGTYSDHCAISVTSQWSLCAPFALTAEAPPVTHTASFCDAAINAIISQTILTTGCLLLILWGMNGILIYYLGFSKIRPPLAKWKLRGTLPCATLVTIPSISSTLVLSEGREGAAWVAH